WQDEDYDVLADRKVVGRIYEDASASTPPGMRWFWSIMIVPAVSNLTNGYAATRDEAMAEFRAGWEAKAGSYCPPPRGEERCSDQKRVGATAPPRAVWPKCGWRPCALGRYPMHPGCEPFGPPARPNGCTARSGGIPDPPKPRCPRGAETAKPRPPCGVLFLSAPASRAGHRACGPGAC